MAQYSAAIDRDQLADLIDRALAGEEVVITRNGRPTVTLNKVEASTPSVDVRSATERLQSRLAGTPALAMASAYFREWLYQDYPY